MSIVHKNVVYALPSSIFVLTQVKNGCLERYQRNIICVDYCRKLLYIIFTNN